MRKNKLKTTQIKSNCKEKKSNCVIKSDKAELFG